MLNRSASLAMSTCVLKALPGKLDIKRHSPSILFIQVSLRFECTLIEQNVQMSRLIRLLSGNNCHNFLEEETPSRDVLLVNLFL